MILDNTYFSIHSNEEKEYKHIKVLIRRDALNDVLSSSKRFRRRTASRDGCVAFGIAV